MYGWLRRHAPGNALGAVLYWMGIALGTLFLLFLLFYFVVDPLLPAMF